MKTVRGGTECTGTRHSPVGPPLEVDLSAAAAAIGIAYYQQARDSKLVFGNKPTRHPGLGLTRGF
ncbi:hypothetical protein [Novipirellula sp.]|uniref:hypothetical protein n=1 Tax=Novipirellula sp. TaxID=2795430 RepID=UPI00356346C3